MFSALRHIVSKPSSLAFRTTYEPASANLPTVKNAMYLASLKLVKQITIEGAEDYALTTKSPRCSLDVFDNKS